MQKNSFQKSPHGETDGTCAGCGLVSWFLPARLNVADAKQIERVTEHRRAVKRNQYLLRASEPLNFLYILNSGSVKTSMPNQGGIDQLIGFSMPGDIIGMEAISDGKYLSDVIALEDTTFCGIRYGDLMPLSQSIPALQHHLHQGLSREINRHHDLMFLLGSMSAEERLKAFLLHLSDQYSARGHSAAHFRLSMTRQDIGSHLGLTVETISRTLTRLHAEKMIDVNGRDITIKDSSTMQRIFDAPRLHVA